MVPIPGQKDHLCESWYRKETNDKRHTIPSWHINKEKCPPQPTIRTPRGYRKKPDTGTTKKTKSTKKMNKKKPKGGKEKSNQMGNHQNPGPTT